MSSLGIKFRDCCTRERGGGVRYFISEVRKEREKKRKKGERCVSPFPVLITRRDRKGKKKDIEKATCKTAPDLTVTIPSLTAGAGGWELLAVHLRTSWDQTWRMRSREPPEEAQ